jgi:hypothetical protein
LRNLVCNLPDFRLDGVTLKTRPHKVARVAERIPALQKLDNDRVDGVIEAHAYAMGGEIAVIDVSLLTVNEAAGTKPNITDVAPVKLTPLITTLVPPAGGPEDGLRLKIRGTSDAFTTIGPHGGGQKVSILMASGSAKALKRLDKL